MVGFTGTAWTAHSGFRGCSRNCPSRLPHPPSPPLGESAENQSVYASEDRHLWFFRLVASVRATLLLTKPDQIWEQDLCLDRHSD
jgi:hypothetical protein